MAISKIIYKSSPQDTGTVWMDATPATAEAGDITAPKTAMLSNGILTTGTGSGGGSVMYTYENLTAYAFENGYLRSTGVIDTTVSGGVVKKFNLPAGTTSVALRGTSGLYVSGSYWAVYWFVANGEMISYYSPITEPEVFYYKEVEVPEGATEFWSTEVVPSTKTKPIEPVDKSELGGHWRNRKWYAYGTSITDTSTTGRYPQYLAAISGMKLFNKGIAGGGIGNLGGYSTGQVYSAICNTTDGKLNADLITLETGANDEGASVPLGTVYDTGTSTLAGCLNDCLRYLQTNTNAQIAVTYSPASTTAPNATDKYYEWEEMVERICKINRVHYLKSATNMGYAKLTSSSGSLYVEDNIHQTTLGGYIMAENLWYQLRNIPLFYTEMPNGDEEEPSEDWETIYSGTVYIDGTDDNTVYYTSVPVSMDITLNSVWRITFNGVPYVCTVTSAGDPDGTPYAIGNVSIIGQQGGNNEPFMIQKFWNTTVLILTPVGQTATLKIEELI